jgi:hypothetical protein
MGTCADCLFQGDRNADEKGNTNVFCLVKGNWSSEKVTCSKFRDYADLSKDIRNRFAVELRQEESEDRRLSKILKSNFHLVIAVLVVSFILFWVTVKFFDKYIF